MTRLPRHCLEPGCPNLTRTGPRCPTHTTQRRQQGWHNFGPEWQRLRLTVLKRDHHTCQLQLPGCLGVATHADHVVPVARGGRPELSNLQASCSSCNKSKGDR